jgi:type I restriction enzyme, S subunit
MTDWREKPLGDVCELKRGYDLPRRDREDGPVPIVSSSGVTDHSTAKVKAPGVVTGRYGTLGEVFYLEDDFWPLNTALYVRDFKGNDPEFVAALLTAMDLAQHDGAAAVPGLNRNQLHKVPVSVPTPEVQHRVAQTLRCLDDLIGNNRRRVEVLEEMARAIYREWFVHFRFPGREDATFVDSDLGTIPEGWEWRPFTEVASFMNGFAFKPAHLGDEGWPVIKIKQLKGGVTADTPRSDPLAIKENYWIEPGDLLMSWSAHLGVYWWMDEPGLLNQHLFKVSAIAEFPELYLFHDLDRDLLLPKLVTGQIDVAVEP